MEEEQVRQEAAKEARKAKGFEPFRFWTPVGTTRQIVIVDEAPDFFRYEHALKDKRSGRFDNYLPCINEDANCPVCGVTDKPSYFGMYLTVIDLTPYENRDGAEVPWSKKIMVVKPAQQKKITRLFEKHGTLFGMCLDMTRDGDKDASIGNDIEFVDFFSQEEMEAFYTEYTDKDNKVQAIDGMVPFDYDEIYPEMTEEQLAVCAGVPVTEGVGNRRSVDREIGRGGARQPGRRGAREEAADDAPTRPARTAGRREAREEEEPADAPQRPARGAATRQPAARPAAAPARTAGRRSPPAEEEHYDDDQQAEAPARPASRRPAATAAPAPRAAARPTRQPAEPADAPQRPARTAARPAATAAARPAGRRAATPAEDPPFEDETPPPAAAGRAALRARRS